MCCIVTSTFCTKIWPYLQNLETFIVFKIRYVTRRYKSLMMKIYNFCASIKIYF